MRFYANESKAKEIRFGTVRFASSGLFNRKPKFITCNFFEFVA